MANDQGLVTNEFPMTKPEWQKLSELALSIGQWVIVWALVIGHWSLS